MLYFLAVVEVFYVFILRYFVSKGYIGIFLHTYCQTQYEQQQKQNNTIKDYSISVSFFATFQTLFYELLAFL